MTTSPAEPPESTLTADEREELLIASHTVEPQHLIGEALFATVERIVAARVAQLEADLAAAKAKLAAVEALVAEWQSDLDTRAIREEIARYCWSTSAREVRRALATQPAP